jgi:hypothetical protein
LKRRGMFRKSLTVIASIATAQAPFFHERNS